MKINVVIPVYNEEKIILDTIKKIKDFVKENDGYFFTFVNDGSTDKSKEIIEKETDGEDRINLLSYDKNRGKGYAVKYGVTGSDADTVIFTDSDLAYGLSSVKRLSEELMYGECEVCVGSRNISKDGYGEYSFLRRTASKAYIKLLSFFGGLKLSDSQCGLKGYKNPFAKKIFSLCETDGFAFDYETILIARKAKLKIKEIPVKVINHNGKDSKVHIVKDSIKMLSDMRKIKKRIKKTEI